MYSFFNINPHFQVINWYKLYTSEWYSQIHMIMTFDTKQVLVVKKN